MAGAIITAKTTDGHHNKSKIRGENLNPKFESFNLHYKQGFNRGFNHHKFIKMSLFVF